MRVAQTLIRARTIAARHPATVEDERVRNWGTVADRISRLAAGLSRLGVAAGDRVAILAHNCDAYFESYYAIIWAGGVLVPLNTRLAIAEIEFQVRDAGARILLFGREFSQCAGALKSSGAIQTAIAMDERAAHADYESESLIAGDPMEDAGRGGSALAGIFYTGGTTGLPKGVMLTHASLHTMAANLVMALKIDESCVNFHAAPMFHLADIGILFVTMVGGTHVFQRSFDAADMLRTIAAQRVTHCFTVPIMIERMATSDVAKNLDLSSLRVLGYGGAPMPAGAFERARARFPNVDFVQGFGQTEFPACTILDPKHHRPDADPEKLQSAGVVCHGYEIKIVDTDGREAPRRTVGEIVGRGANMMAGYWNRAEETAEVLRNGWIHTRDLGFMDDDGFIYVTDRLKDMIVTGAENVYSIEVENVMSRHPAIKECAVIGIPDDQWGERVHAVIVLKRGATLTLQELTDFCRKNIAGYKCPKSMESRADALPRSAAGKVLKAELRSPHWRGRARAV